MSGCQSQSPGERVGSADETDQLALFPLSPRCLPTGSLVTFTARSPPLRCYRHSRGASDPGHLCIDTLLGRLIQASGRHPDPFQSAKRSRSSNFASTMSWPRERITKSKVRMFQSDADSTKVQESNLPDLLKSFCPCMQPNSTISASVAISRLPAHTGCFG